MSFATRAIARIAGLLTRSKAAPVGMLQGVDGRSRGSWHSLYDSDVNLGDWQKDIIVDRNAVMANWAIFSCITLIAADIGKVSLDLVEIDNGIEIDAFSPAFSPVIRKPNPFQTRQQFIESWVTSKLSQGNTYVLKVRDSRGVVVRHYVLDPYRVTPLVAPGGEVYYRLGPDRLSEISMDDENQYVPASEVIHDRMNCLFHPLVGLSPIFASGLSAMQGLKIQQNSAKFFQNMSRPSGILTAPGQISDETALRLKQHWEKNYGQDNIGKIAVLGDDLKYQAMTVSAIDAQLTEQLKASAEMICSTFHVPPFKIGAQTIPVHQKVEDLNQIYYSDCLHALMDAIQTLLVEGLGLDTPKQGITYAVRFNLDDLMQMDTATQIATLNEAVKGGWMAPNEARARRNLKPVKGGSSPLAQQQFFSLQALSERDQNKPFAKPTAAPAAAPATTTAPDDSSSEGGKMLSFAAIEAKAAEVIRKAMLE